MAKHTTITLSIDPCAWQRVKRGRFGQAYVPGKTRCFKENIKALLKQHFSGEMATDAISIHITFDIKRPKSVKRPHPSVRPDLDNFEKGVLDAAIGILWKDDSLICEKNSVKRYAATGSISIQIWPIDHGAAEDAID